MNDTEKATGQSKPAVLDSIAGKPQLAFQALMPRVTSEFGKSLGGQMKDLLSLCMRGHKLSVDEYYNMCLFDDETYSAEDKKRFVGLQKSREIWLKLMKVNKFTGLVNDKLAYEIFLRGFGIAAPKTLAVTGGHYPARTVRKLVSAEDFTSFFEQAAFPIFGKPVNSTQSFGSARFEAYDATTGALTLSSGASVSVGDLMAEIQSKFKGNYLFQDCIEAHPALASICGKGLPTVRVVTLDSGHGPEIYRAAIKLTGENNVADNFWRAGNLLAPVDTATGTLAPALTQMGIDGTFVDTHPDTGAQITGVTLPYWDDVVAMTREAASLLPGAVLLGFDVALGTDGPLIVEANNDPQLIMLQIAHRKGVLDEPMLNALAYVEQGRAAAQAELKAHLEKEKAEKVREMKDAAKRKAA